MSRKELSYDDLERNVQRWARERSDIRAIFVVGSRARRHPPADKHSDLDLILYTTDRTVYTSTSQWLREFGTVWVSDLGETGAGDPEWTVLYQGGLKADLVLAWSRSDHSLSLLVEESPYRSVFERGMRVLLNRTGDARPMRIPQLSGAADLPSPAEFARSVNLVLITAFRSAKFALRNDLWRAKRLCDCELKAALLQMVRWHVQSLHGPETDTWYEGRFLANWAEQRVLHRLPQTFAEFSKSDLQRALLETLDLFVLLADETAQQLGFEFPSAGQKQAIDWLKALPGL